MQAGGINFNNICTIRQLNALTNFLNSAIFDKNISRINTTFINYGSITNEIHVELNFSSVQHNLHRLFFSLMHHKGNKFRKKSGTNQFTYHFFRLHPLVKFRSSYISEVDGSLLQCFALFVGSLRNFSRFIVPNTCI
ncbi:MAG: hypothetical protein BWY67_01470 [Bacteroidetes bacterium ADurb.Bin397]|nr:MAG: hypothetical protein BWY67_01470 [Bacteroidetes bacterium ADurb.Bin397]